MRKITYSQAFVEGLDYCMRKMRNFSLVGNEVMGLGPHRVHLERIWKTYPDRVRFPPTSEAAFSALAAWGPYQVEQSVYLEIPEWIVGYGALRGATAPR